MNSKPHIWIFQQDDTSIDLLQHAIEALGQDVTTSWDITPPEQCDLCLWSPGNAGDYNPPELAHLPRSCPMFLILPDPERLAAFSTYWNRLFSAGALGRVTYTLTDEKACLPALRFWRIPRAQITLTAPHSPPQTPTNFSKIEREGIGQILATRPVWLVAGMPMGELDTILRVYKAAQRSAHRLMMILHPADPSQTHLIRDKARQQGMITHTREDDAEPESITQVFITDGADEELGLWYHLAPLCYMGGTLSSGAPLSPDAPVLYGSAMIHGPNTRPFQETYTQLADNNASIPVAGADDLITAVTRLIAPDQSAEIACAAWDMLAKRPDPVQELQDRIQSVLFPKPEHPTNARP